MNLSGIDGFAGLVDPGVIVCSLGRRLKRRQPVEFAISGIICRSLSANAVDPDRGRA